MIINQDCFDWMKRQESNILDVVVSSPPYNINLGYNTYADKRDKDG